MQRFTSSRSHSIGRTNPWAQEHSCRHIIPRLPARSEWRERLLHNSGGRNVIHLFTLPCRVLQNIDERQSAEEVCLHSRTRGVSSGGGWRMEDGGERRELRPWMGQKEAFRITACWEGKRGRFWTEAGNVTANPSVLWLFWHVLILDWVPLCYGRCGAAFRSVFFFTPSFIISNMRHEGPSPVCPIALRLPQPRASLAES